MKKLYDFQKSSLELINDYEQIVFHQNVSKIQRLCYKNTLNSVEAFTGKIFKELDYKQRQVCQEYYNQIMRSCLGKFLSWLPKVCALIRFLKLEVLKYLIIIIIFEIKFNEILMRH